MYKKEKVKAMLSPDYTGPVGSCGFVHLPEFDRGDPQVFAEKTIALTDANEWDIVKIMANVWYVQEAYGEDLEFYGKCMTPEYLKIKKFAGIRTPYIKNVRDLAMLPELPADHDIFKENAEVVRIISRHYQESIPVIATIFTPCSLLADLCGGNDRFLKFTEEAPEAVSHALNSLMKTLCNLIDLFADAGADGFFLASKHSSPSMISPEGFERFCASYDVPMIEYANTRTWLNILHAHGKKNMYMDRYAKYPVQAINWESAVVDGDSEGVTSVADMASMTDKLLIGGTDQFHDFYGTPDEVRNRLRDRLETAAKEAGGHRLLFAPGCSLPPAVPAENVLVQKEVINEYNAANGLFS